MKLPVPALAAAAIVLQVFINPFAGQIRTTDEFGSKENNLEIKIWTDKGLVCAIGT
jgi:hypothetical protein